MIITVWSPTYVEIGPTSYRLIEDRDRLVDLMKDIIRAAYLSKEDIVLEIGDVVDGKQGESPRAEFKEIGRWTTQTS